MKIIDLGSRRQDHWQPVHSAILGTTGLLISLDVVATVNIAATHQTACAGVQANWYRTDTDTQRGDQPYSTAAV